MENKQRKLRGTCTVGDYVQLPWLNQAIDEVISMPVSTCRVQSDSMQGNPCSLRLAKKMERGGVSVTIREGRHGEMKDGMGMGGWGDHKVENKCDFSCHRKGAMSFAR